MTLKALLADGVLGEVSLFESHFDRFRPGARPLARARRAGKWYLVRSGAALVGSGHSTFGLPVSMTVDLAQLRPGAQSTDYFHAILSYPQRRVILHGTMLAAAESARYIVHGSRGSYVKYGLDPVKNG